MDSAKRKMKTNKKKKVRNLSLIKVLFFTNLIAWGVMTIVLNQIMLNTNKIYFNKSSSEEIIDIEKFLTALTLTQSYAKFHLINIKVGDPSTKAEGFILED